MRTGIALVRKGWAKTGIVLGGGMTAQGKLLSDAKTRIHLAHHLLAEGYISRLVVSGRHSAGTDAQVTEAQLYADYLAEQGINKTSLLLEEKSRDTIGNAVYTKKLFLRYNLPRTIVLITSDYHLQRALVIFTHIFGPSYSFVGLASKPHILHRFRMRCS